MKGKVIAAILVVVALAGGGIYYFGFYNANGTLRLTVTDPMPVGWSDIYINVTSVSIHNTTAGTDGGYTKAFSSPVTINLANATNTSIFLTGLSIPAGHYQMIRLVIKDAYGIYNGVDRPQTFVFTLVNGTVDVAGQFSIAKGSTTTVNLDFNSAQAVHGSTAAGFTMTPVVAMS